MFREMRRKKQQLSQEETVRVLKSCSYGVLAVSGEEGYPYALPLNYVYEDGKIYIHSAVTGHKLDSVARSGKVSFCVVAESEVVAERFTTAYESVIAFGTARLLEDESEKLTALRLFVKRFSEAFEAEGEAAIKTYWRDVCILVVEIEHMTGKAGMETLKRRQVLSKAGSERGWDRV